MGNLLRKFLNTPLSIFNKNLIYNALNYGNYNLCSINYTLSTISLPLAFKTEFISC